jgi:hypothetical protein
MSASTRVRALFTAAICGLATVVALALPSQQLPAQAADLRAFEPGFIISDALFYDSGTMSAAAVQAFIVQKGSSCQTATGNTCLKDFRQTTVARAADAYCTRPYTKANSETAGGIISKVAVSCGINPQALIVMLQKEQGLVTRTTGGSALMYRGAMGYGCPDTAPCAAQYFGFFNQVYMAAHQYQNYAKNPMKFGHRAGMVNQVRYQPNAACGSSAVFIRNQATASLYNYTPYQPNAAALAAGYGTGDRCSAYGNRNFWNYFTDWFGPTTQRAPLGSLDAATSTSPGVISVRGWAVDPDTTASINVHVYVDGKVKAGFAAVNSRPDVGRIHRRGDNHGFSGDVNAPNGTHQVCVYAIDSVGGSNPRIGCATVKVTNHAPIGALDAVMSTEGRISVRGWALDPDTSASLAVHVYVDGKAVQALTANSSRPDVGRLYGKGDNHGFSGTVNALAGTHQVCLYAIDASGGTNPRVGCKSVTVTNLAPTGALDTLTSGMESFTLGGWAVDPDASNPIAVDVYVDGKMVQTLTANTSRADVGRIYGKGDNHGYQTTFSATYGPHEVCTFAIDSWGGSNTKVGCSTVDVNGTAFGALDSAVATSPGKITVSGWAIDPNTIAPIVVHLRVDGKLVQALTANSPRTDVGRIYGKGDNHGFSGTVNALAGTHQVCVYAIDSWNWTIPTNPLLKRPCPSVMVP